MFFLRKKKEREKSNSKAIYKPRKVACIQLLQEHLFYLIDFFLEGWCGMDQ